ncbi:MAG: hypothetical protein M5R36_27000 [Deltaproteobacteria bacterium]|nr:hypothetical protein [Deltaproteobacteria bacterium]
MLKLHIVDKDWWLDRVAGGNSMIQSRHMAAAAAYKDADGKYYYKTCTFHEYRLLTGGFGPLNCRTRARPSRSRRKTWESSKNPIPGPT